MELHKGIQAIQAKTRKEWRKWLDKNGQVEKSVWLIIYRKETNATSVYYDEAVEEALCFGWIDSVANKRDADSFYLYFAQRKPTSKWSKLNRDRVAKLESEGLIMPPGKAAIDLAKKNGTWEALKEVEALTIPADMQKLFDKNKTAYANFMAFPPSTIRGILEWILNAKRPETRLNRITETVEKAELNIRAK
ncbi:MAG: YdeI/OmpD-associated family protein [Sphingobacteriales bacterium JAD_PAG50586_3]|nr:MAG: YdeI/OmpD-associated family protein [Sphingobacteriales bacterium JAD_PAG50586_3]